MPRTNTLHRPLYFWQKVGGAREYKHITTPIVNNRQFNYRFLSRTQAYNFLKNRDMLDENGNPPRNWVLCKMEVDTDASQEEMQRVHNIFNDYYAD